MFEQEGIRKRAQSVTRAEKIQAEEKKVRKQQPDKPWVFHLKNYDKMDD